MSLERVGHLPTQDPVADLRLAIVALDAQRQELVEAGDTEAILTGVKAVQTIRRDLGVLERDMLRDGGRMVTERFTDIDGVGRFERVREAGKDAWDDEATLFAVLRPIADPDMTGEVPSWLGEAVEAILAACRPSWRSTALKSAGIDPDGDRPLRDRTPLEDRAWTIRVH